MALHHTLPIYKVAYDLFDMTIDLVKNMPRDYKVSIGSKLRDESIGITTLIFNANVAREKLVFIDKLLERLQVIELMLRLSRDKRVISTGQYARTVELTTSIGKQASGWRKSATSPAS
ncbi:MAG: four helix bundle protein [Pseudomonadota bacterium]